MRRTISDLIPWGRERSVGESPRRQDPFWSLQREMNRMFEDFAQGFGLTPWSAYPVGGASLTPSVDVHETETEIQISADLPGIEEKDIDISICGDVLTLKGERREEREEKGKEVQRLERSWGRFERSVPLPCEVEPEKANASYTQGVLTVTLPKAPSARRRVHHIEVTGD